MEFTEKQKEMLNELQDIIANFSEIEGIELTLEIKNGMSSYKVFYENKPIIVGTSDNLIEAALKAEEAVLNYFNTKED